MYEIDFLTCSASDVIQRSITCHPSLFLDGVRSLRDTHRNYSGVTRDATVSRIAAKAADDCNVVMAAIQDDDIARITETLGRLVQAFTVAAKLNLVPRDLQGEILER